jgi:hypothetical protein
VKTGRKRPIAAGRIVSRPVFCAERVFRTDFDFCICTNVLYTAPAKSDFRSALPFTGGTHDEALAATGALRYSFTGEGGAILA